MNVYECWIVVDVWDELWGFGCFFVVKLLLMVEFYFLLGKFILVCCIVGVCGVVLFEMCVFCVIVFFFVLGGVFVFVVNLVNGNLVCE